MFPFIKVTADSSTIAKNERTIADNLEVNPIIDTQKVNDLINKQKICEYMRTLYTTKINTGTFR